MNEISVNRLSEVAKLFLKLGTIAFGGPAAHIAMMEDEVVNRRQWLTSEQFLDLVGATNLIPGPNSTEMAIHIGYIYAGGLGLMVAGACFIFPAVLITAILAWAYLQFGQLPEVNPLLYGIKPAVLAVILVALWRLGKKAVKSSQLLAIAIAVAIAVLLGVNEVLALLLGGVVGAIGLNWQKGVNLHGWIMGALLTTPPGETGIEMAISPGISGPITEVSLWKLGLFFLKVGSILYGSGYVLIAFLQEGLVEEWGWLTQQQLLDAIAIGQFTPGPVLSTATFIGYIIAGLPGSVVATLGIFLPSFLFVLALNPSIPRLRRSRWTSAFLDAVNASAVALMAVVTLELASTILIKKVEMPVATPLLLIDWIAFFITAIAAFIAFRYRVNTAWLVIGGAIAGAIARGLPI